jgi:hypothetical protein
MADEFSELSFKEDLAEVLSLPESSRWKIESVGPLEVYVTLSSEKAPDNLFQARLLWNAYPTEPPSLKFRDPASGRLDLPTAWPEIRGFRPASLDACVNWCSEGFTLHPEWKNDPNVKWNPQGNALLRTLRRMQREFDEFFVKRFQQ